METIQPFFYYLLHIDQFLANFAANYGTLTYILLFVIIFCETGLVITPFLPGDSLLFVAGSLAADSTSALNIQFLCVLLILASILGNKINYLIGRYIGLRLFSQDQSLLFNKKYLHRAHQFYEKHGGKTILIARFVPILRTFGPFVAGIGTMSLVSFSLFNLLSAVLWVGTLLTAGYYFGSLPFIKTHFTIVIYGIIIISLLPPLVSYFHHRAK